VCKNSFLINLFLPLLNFGRFFLINPFIRFNYFLDFLDLWLAFYILSFFGYQYAKNGRSPMLYFYKICDKLVQLNWSLFFSETVKTLMNNEQFIYSNFDFILSFTLFIIIFVFKKILFFKMWKVLAFRIFFYIISFNFNFILYFLLFFILNYFGIFKKFGLVHFLNYLFSMLLFGFISHNVDLIVELYCLVERVKLENSVSLFYFIFNFIYYLISYLLIKQKITKKQKYILMKFVMMTLNFKKLPKGSFFSSKGPYPFLFKLEEYDDYFQLPSIPLDLLDQEKRIRWTLAEMEKIFGKQGEIQAAPLTLTFSKDNPNIILPLKIDSTSINRLYTTTFQSGHQSYPIVPSKEYQKLSDEYNRMMELNNLKSIDAPTAQWTGNNYSTERVLCSTSRYGQPEFDFENYDSEKMLETMSRIYQPMLDNSRLTHPKKFFRKWKLGLSSGFGSLKNGRYQKRRAMFSKIPRSGITDFAKFLCSNLDKIAAIPHTFGKMEYLFGDKWKKLRSIIGAPFFTYFTNQIFAYEPDHRFTYNNTPAQVGRPLTGFGLLPLFRRYIQYPYVFGLDMSAFDSTFNHQVMESVAALREWGYRNHSQYDEISKLIRLSYKQNYSDPLFSGSTGEILEKVRGNATGAVSTSQTNCLALGIILSQFFHETTGLGYDKFFELYDLSNYGDDNILGCRPQGHHTTEELRNTIYDIVQLCSTKYNGTIFLKIESEGSIFDCEFLSKSIFKLNDDESNKLSTHFGKYYSYGVRHNYNKIVQKFDKFKKSKPQETDFIQKFAAYKLMSVHYPDLFATIDQLFNNYVKENPKCIKNPHYKIAASTYDQILIKFYEPLSKHYAKVMATEFEEMGEETDNKVSIPISETIMGFLKQLYNNLSPMILDLTCDLESNILMKHLLKYYNQDISNYVQQIAEKSSMTPDETIKLLQRNNLPLFNNYEHSPNHSFFSYIDHILMMVVFNYKGITNFLKYKLPFDPVSLFFDFVNRMNSGISFCSGVTMNNISSFVKFDTTNNFYLLFLLFLIIIRKHFIFNHFSFNINIPVINIEKYIIQIFNNIKQYFFSLDSCKRNNTAYQTKYEEVLNELNLSEKTLFHAPTGWGKSTHFLVALQKALNKRVVVIVPRAILAESIPKYLRSQYDIEIGQWSYGSTNVTGDIIFSTPDSFLLRSKGKEFVILDEAHINEPQYRFIKENQIPDMYFTATPSDDIQYQNHYTVPGATPFEIEQTDRQALNFDHYVAACFNSVINNSFSKILIYVPTIEKGTILASRLSKRGIKSQLLNSENKIVNENSRVFISTSVADAGLTIPSVDLVISSDLDVHVTEQKPYFFRLSQQTIVQRKGRTGRTCNGRFYFYKIQSVPFHGSQHWHPVEEMVACSFAATNSNFSNEFYTKYETEVFEFFGKEVIALNDITTTFSGKQLGTAFSSNDAGDGPVMNIIFAFWFASLVPKVPGLVMLISTVLGLLDGLLINLIYTKLSQYETLGTFLFNFSLKKAELMEWLAHEGFIYISLLFTACCLFNRYGTMLPFMTAFLNFLKRHPTIAKWYIRFYVIFVLLAPVALMFITFMTAFQYWLITGMVFGFETYENFDMYRAVLNAQYISHKNHYELDIYFDNYVVLASYTDGKPSLITLDVNSFLFKIFKIFNRSVIYYDDADYSDLCPKAKEELHKYIDNFNYLKHYQKLISDI